MSPSLFALVDCNNFYASCERVFNPALANRPIIVLSNNDGCVIARSAEAKHLGIPMGAPYHTVKQLCRTYQIAVFSSNYELYGDMSDRVMLVLKDLAPAMEVYSIDEAFLDLQLLCHDNLPLYGNHIRQTVRQYTGIPTSVGIAPTKTLAKLANQLAKTSKSGVHCLLQKEAILQALSTTPIEHIWGIGRQSAQRLHYIGIRTALDFASAPTAQIRKILHVTGQRIQWELQGTSCLPLESMEPRKHIQTSRSFGKAVTALEEIEEALAYFVSNAAEKLRHQQYLSNALYIYIRTSPFAEPQARYRNNLLIPLPLPTDYTPRLIEAAKEGLRHIFKPGYRYQKAGVVLMDLVPIDAVQPRFDVLPAPEKHGQLMQAMDKLNQRFGRNTVGFAATGTTKTWMGKKEHRSPCYTTKFDELALVMAN